MIYDDVHLEKWEPEEIKEYLETCQSKGKQLRYTLNADLQNKLILTTRNNYFNML